VTEPVLRRRCRIYVDGVYVGWVVKREGRFRAYVTHPQGGFMSVEGSSRRAAAQNAWSARCVLDSLYKEQSTEEPK
jgi:hypothetical protein